MNPYPMIMEPILKPKVWGGRALDRLGKDLPPETLVGESWELADLPDVPGSQSVIRNGVLAGRTLREALAEHQAAIMGATRLSDQGGFPLLVKYLDAYQNLSVQVHPSPAYAKAHPAFRPKSEAWYVIAARPGAVIYKGIRPGVSRETFLEDLHAGRVEQNLQALPARAGDCHYLPSGTCHALGRGVLVAEVQTPSDTTFRLYDWGRRGRPLHVEHAIACIDFDDPRPPSLPEPPPPIRRAGIASQPLLETAHFALERIEVTGPAGFPIVTNRTPEVWMVLEGALRVESRPGQSDDVTRGATALIPAALSEAAAVSESGAVVLRITLASVLRNMMA